MVAGVGRAAQLAGLAADGGGAERGRATLGVGRTHLRAVADRAEAVRVAHATLGVGRAGARPVVRGGRRRQRVGQRRSHQAVLVREQRRAARTRQTREPRCVQAERALGRISAARERSPVGGAARDDAAVHDHVVRGTVCLQEAGDDECGAHGTPEKDLQGSLSFSLRLTLRPESEQVMKRKHRVRSARSK